MSRKSLVRGPLSVVLLLFSCTPSQPSSPTLATIADQTVTLAEFQKYLGTEQWKFGVNPPALTKEKLLDNFLKDHLLLMEAKKRGIEVSPQEVDQSVEKFKAHYPKSEDFEKLLALKGWTLKDFNDRQAEELTIQKLVDAVAAEQLELSEKDLQHYFDQHRKEFRRGEEVHARQIVTDSNEKTEALRETLVKGAAFEEAALKYSLSPDRKQGGDLGWFERGEMPKEFDAVCFALPAGELSPVIKTPYGFHLFQVLEKRPPRQLTFEEVQDEIRGRLKSELGRAVFQKWYDALRAQTEVKIDAEVFNQIQ